MAWRSGPGKRKQHSWQKCQRSALDASAARGLQRELKSQEHMENLQASEEPRQKSLCRTD